MIVCGLGEETDSNRVVIKGVSKDTGIKVKKRIQDLWTSCPTSTRHSSMRTRSFTLKQPGMKPKGS